jgi:spermidine synthase
VIPQAGLLGPALLFGLVRAFGLPGFGTRWVIAALVVVPPAVLMGVAFPILQRVVARDVASLGRHTGALLFANTAGAFAGVTVTGLVLLDHLGTPRTLTLLAALALVFEVAIWHRRGGTPRAWRGLAAAAVVVAAMTYLCPEPGPFWAALHATPAAEFHAREDSTCLAALKMPSPAPEAVQAELAVNGKWQGNPYPFFTFHMNLGLLPALLAERPERALVIGLGIGSTAATQVAEPRIRSMDVVEICAGEERLLRGHLADQPEFARLFNDPRVRFHVADGRRFLMLAAERFDLIVTDTLLPQWSGSGGLYSQEFYRLVASRLSAQGVLAQWMVTPRTALTAASVFPYVLKLRGPTLRSGVLLMSRRPLRVDRKAALADLERLVPYLSPREHGVARRALIDLEVSAVRAGGAPPAAAEGLNTDLFPRDEYSDNWLRRQWKRR